MVETGHALYPPGEKVRCLVFFGRKRRPGGLTAWAQGRHANNWLAALSAPRGPTLSGTVCPSPLTPGVPVRALRDKLRCFVYR